MALITSVNPANNELISSFKIHSTEDINQKVDQAQSCFINFRKSSFMQREQWMLNIAKLLQEDKKLYAQTMTAEMGKTIKSAIAEVEKCAWLCEYYAENGEQFLADEIIETDASKSMICYRPLGIILGIMPWNYPLWQVFRFAVPALMAGNVGILKHASNVPQTAMYIEDLFAKAGFPKGAFTTLLIKSDGVKDLLARPQVKAVTLTGSGPAGSAVASECGKQIKKTVLELGGNDAYIILEDADLEHAAQQCCQSRLLNSGQSCIGAKRFIVVESVYNTFLELFKKKMAAATFGDPTQDFDLGPLARIDLRNEVHQQVQESIMNGAHLELGGFIPELDGAYYPPTILTKVQHGQPAYHEEIFGPVASVIKVKDEDEAISLANDSVFGLGSCVFTQDIRRGERIAKEEIEAGCCFVNQFVKSDPRLPFGGINTSGYGRELSYNGIREFVNIKTVYIR